MISCEQRFRLCVLCTYLVVAVCTLEAVGEKRLVLDGEEDVLVAIGNLQNKVTQLQHRLDEKDVQIQQLSANTGSGSSYIRWGRKTCPGNGTQLVYSGFMAGTQSDDNNIGKGANYLCLTDVPMWDHYTDSTDEGILLTGVEYEFWPHFQSSEIVKFLGSNVHAGEAPCAVCHATRGVTIMIPGRNQCYPGWTTEYSGYLVGGFPKYADSTEYVCLDRRPETITGSGRQDRENYLYFVEAYCSGDGLECPPYMDGRELTCVVCSI